MLVVTLPSSSIRTPAAFARRAKRAGADILEIRGDLTPDVKKFSSPLPLIVSPRGKGTKLAERFNPVYVDFDISESIVKKPFQEKKLILSYHDDKCTPRLSELKKIARQMIALKPFAIKIVTLIQTYDDLVTLEKLRSELKFPRVSIFGMGEKAHLTRVLSPLRDAFTYSYLDGSAVTAPGQLPLSFYRFLRVRRPALSSGKTPRIFGILGGPYVAASQSPVLHNALFQRYKVDAVYSRFPTTDFKQTIGALSKLGVIGYSVTAPFKRDAFLLARKRHPSAALLGVANTFLRKKSGWNAWNTDSEGILRGYPALALAKTVFILGAGGVVPSIIRACRIARPSVAITVFARDARKAQKSLASFAVPVRLMSDIRRLSADVVICAVSEDISLPLPRTTSHKPQATSQNAIDLRYAHTTKFMKQAGEKGYRVYDGLPMLIHQGLRQFEIFTGKKTTKADARVLTKLLSATRSSLPTTR